MARRKASSGGGGGNWLDTYADMVTLLLTFFVMLFSMSTIQEEKWEKLLMAFQSKGTSTEQVIVPSETVTGNESGVNLGAPPSGSGGESEDAALTFETLYEYLKNYVEANDMQANIEVEEGEESVYIRFNDAIFFRPDQSYLIKGSDEILQFLGTALKEVEKELQLVVIAGHTAWVDGDYPVSDWRLSGDRAATVAIYLEDKMGIDGMKLQASGYGAKYPVADNSKPEGRSKNRRVEMMILGDKAKLENKEVIDYFLKGTFDNKRYPEAGGATDILVPENAQVSSVPTPVDENTTAPVGGTTSSQVPPPVSSTPPPVSSTPPPASSTPPPVSSLPPSSAPSVKPPVSSAQPPPVSSKPSDGGGLLSPPK